MKQLLLSILAFAILGLNVQAAREGSDSGTNWTSLMWTNGAAGNIGTWWLVTNGVGTIGPSTAIGDSTQGGRTDIGAQAFNLLPGSYTNANQGYMSAYLVFLDGALSSGQTLKLDLNFLWNNGTKGFALQPVGGGTDIFRIEQDWGDPLNAVVGGATNQILGNAYQQALHVEASRLGSAISINVTNNGTNLMSTNFDSVDEVGQIVFYSGNIDPAQEANAANQSIYFNNVAVVPEPSTSLLLAVGALTLAGYAIRRRR